VENIGVHIGITVVVVSFFYLMSPLEAIKVKILKSQSLHCVWYLVTSLLIRNCGGGRGSKVKMQSTFQNNLEKQKLGIQTKNNNDLNYFSIVQKTLTV